MADFPGGADEVIRVKWISEFRQEGKDVIGTFARARQEYRRAAQEQVRNNQVMIRSAREAAMAAKNQQQAERDRLAEFRKLALSEYNLTRSRNARLKVLQKERERDEIIAARGRERLKALDTSLQQELKQIQASAAKKRTIRNADQRESVQSVRDETRALIAPLREQRAMLLREQRRRTTSDDRRKEIVKERIVLQKEIDRNLAQQRARIAAERRLAASDIEGIRRDAAKIIAQTKVSGRARRTAMTSELERTIGEHRAKISQIKAEADSFETQLRRLETLRSDFGGEIEKIVRTGGIRASDKDIQRIARQAQQRIHMPDIIASRELSNFEDAVKRIAFEARTSGRVSSAAFNDMAHAAERASIQGDTFREITHKAGIAINNFESAKNREVRILRTNTNELGRHNTRMARANDLWKRSKDSLRLSTNEMILFGRTIRLLAIPTMAAAISVLAQALTTAAGGATALASSLAPLVGQLSALAPLAASGAQVFAVWKIGLTNLGQSALSVGKILSTSLGGSTDQFVNSLKNMPPLVQRFAIQVRSQLAPGFQKLREEIQKALFPQFFTALNNAKGGFGAIGPQLVGTANALGGLLRGVGARFGTAPFARDLETQGKRTNTWIRQLTPAVEHLMDAFRNLVIASGPLVTHLVKMTNTFASWASHFTAVQRASGGFAHFFREANNALDTTLSLFGHFAKALINIGRIAYNVLGRQMLKDLRGQAMAFEAWTKSAQGTKKITQYFRELKAPLYEAGRLVRDLVKGFFLISDNQDFFNILNKLRTQVLPALIRMFQSVNKNFAPALIDLLTSLAQTIAALGEAGGLSNLVRALKGLSDLVRFLAQSPLAKPFFALLGAVAIFRTLRFASAISGLTLMTRAASGLAGALGLSVTRAGWLNRLLAERGLANFNPGTVIGPQNIGGGVVLPVGSSLNVRGVTGGLAPGSTLTREVPGLGTITSPINAEEFAAMQAAQRERTFSNLLRRNAGLAAGIGGSLVATAGLIQGGRSGNILAGAGTGAMIGSAFSPVLGTAIGAVVGGLGGFLISLRSTRSAIQRLGDAALKTSEQTATSRERLKEALGDIRGAIIGRREAQTQLRVAQQGLKKAMATPGAQDVRAASQDQVAQAREVLREARHRVSEDLRIIRSNVPALQNRRVEFTKELLGVSAEIQKEFSKKVFKGPMPDLNQKAVDKWISFLDKLKSGPDEKIRTIASNLEKIIKQTNKPPTTHSLNVQLKLFGPTKLLERLFELSPQIRAGKVNQNQIGKAGGGRIPGARVAADTVPALLSPGEFVVTGDGERMLEGMTGIPGVLNMVGAMQRPHFATGGRVRRYAAGGRVSPFDLFAPGEDALRSAIGGSTFQSIVANAVGTAQSAMASAVTADKKGKTADLGKNVPAAYKTRFERMIAEARGWVRQGVQAAPGVGLDIKGRLLAPSDEGKSKVNNQFGLDPGAVISDILRVGLGNKFIDGTPNDLSRVLDIGKSKWLTVFIRPGMASEYDAAIKIGNRGFGFSGGKFTTRDIGGSSSTGGLAWLQYHIPGWPLRRGGRIPRFGIGGRLAHGISSGFHRTVGRLERMGKWVWSGNRKDAGLGGAWHDLLHTFDPRHKEGALNIAGALIGPKDVQVRARDMQFKWKDEQGHTADMPGMVKAEALTRAVTAIKDGQPVGRLSITRKGKGWEVLNAVVHPAMKRQGIGTALFREAERAVGIGNLVHSKLLTEEGAAFAAAVKPLRKRVGGFVSDLRKVANRVGHGLSAGAHGALRGVQKAGHFFSNLSRKSNIEWQAEVLAKNLRSRGFSDNDSWDFAHQIAKEWGLNTVDKQFAAVPAAANLLRREKFHHRFRGGGRVQRFAHGGFASGGQGLLFGDELKNFIIALSKKYGLDPNAVLAVVASEGGLGGAVGDRGTSFGPFQLHAGGALPVPVEQGFSFAQSAAGVRYALQKIANVAAGLKGAAAIQAIVTKFERPANPGAEIARALGGGGGGLGFSGGFPGVSNDFGLSGQGQEAVALTGFANSIRNQSSKVLGNLVTNIQTQLKALGDALLKAQLAGKQVLVNKITAQIGELQSQLQIVEGAIGEKIARLGRQITQWANKVTAFADKLANRISRLGLDPAGSTALQMTQKVLARTTDLNRQQLKAAIRQLKILRDAHAPQDILDQQVAAVAAARQAFRGAATQQILGKRAIIARRFERGETRASVAEQLAELGLSNLETRQRIAGTFDSGGGERAGFIRSTIVPAIQKEINAVQATLDHAAKLKLTEDQKNEKLIQLAQLNNQLQEANLAANEASANALSKMLGKLTFEFNGQTWNDMIGAGVGI